MESHRVSSDLWLVCPNLGGVFEPLPDTASLYVGADGWADGIAPGVDDGYEISSE